MYSIFRAVYDSMAKELFEKNSEDLNQVEMNTVLEAVKDVIPRVKAPSSQSFDDGILLYKTEPVLTDSTTYGDVQAHSKSANETRRAKIYRRVPMSPGASVAALLTQNQDADGTARNLRKHPVQQIFDAYVLSVAQDNIANEANKDFLELGLRDDWSQIGAVSEGIAHMIKQLDLMYKDNPNGKEAIYKAIRKIQLAEVAAVRVNSSAETIAKTSTIEEVAEKIATLAKETNERRKQLQGMRIVSEQFVLDAEHAFEYNGATKILTDNTGMNDTEAETVVADITAEVDDILKCSKG
jgi:hypothetical protein